MTTETGPTGRVAAARRPKVFGVGLPRTGTASIALAMMELGFKTCHTCFHDALFDAGQAFFNTPVYADYRRLDRRYPGSKFILTWRDPEQWYASFSRSLGGFLDHLRIGDASAVRDLVDRRCYTQVFGTLELSAERFLARFVAHRHQVEEYLRDRPGDLLVLDVAASDAWDAVCQFLDMPALHDPFPRLNLGVVDSWERFTHPNKLT